jgi:hypothetical protein
MLMHSWHGFANRLRRRPHGKARAGHARWRHGRALPPLQSGERCHAAFESLEDRLLLSAAPLLYNPPIVVSGPSLSLESAQPIKTSAAPATATLNTTAQIKSAASSPPAISGLAPQVNDGENHNDQFWPTLTDPAATSTSDSLSLSVTNGQLQLLRTNGVTFTSGTNDSSSMTITGTLASLSAAISGVNYDPTIGLVGSDTLQLTLANSSDSLSGSAAVSITLIVPPLVGTPLTTTVGVTATVLNNSSYTFAPDAFALSDINASGTSDSAEISVGSVANGPGTVSLGSLSGVSVVNGSNGSSSMTINGTLASLNAALNTLAYTPNAAFTGESQVYVWLQNSVNGLYAANAVTFDVLDPNGPRVTAPAPLTLAMNQSLAFTGTNAVSVTDPGASGSSDSVRIALGTGTLSLGTTNGLTFTNGSNNSNLMTVTGSLSDLNAALSTLTYTAQPFSAGSYGLYITVTNSVDNLTAAAIVPMTIAPPVLTAPASESLNDNSSLTFPSGSISVADAGAIYDFDGFAYESVTLSAANGTLALGSTNGLMFSFGSNNSSLISVTGTLANVNAALNGLVYTPNAGFTGSDAIQISFKDWFDGLIASATVPLAVNAVPSVTAPSNVSLNENSSYNFAAAISVTDSTASAPSDSLSLSVSDGQLTLGSTAGLTIDSGSNSSSSMTVTGSLNDLNQALGGLVYVPNVGYVGSDSLRISVQDAGNNLAGSAAVPISVNPLPPYVVVPSSLTVLENSELSLGNAGLSVSDAGGTSESLSFWATLGEFLIPSSATTGITVTGNVSVSITLSGSLSNINNALNSLYYIPDIDFIGTDYVRITDVDTATHLTVKSGAYITTVGFMVNGPSSLAVTENTAGSFSSANGNAISLIDGYAGTYQGWQDSLTLSAKDGAMTLGSTNGLTFSSGSNGSSSMTVVGSLDNLNAALNGLVYAPNFGFSGTDTLQISLDDLHENFTTSRSVWAIVNGVPTIGAPATATTSENSSYTFSSGAITLTDATATVASDSLSLSVADGQLTLGSTAGLTFDSGYNGSSSMTVTGPLANLNAAVSGLVYTPNSGYSGTDSLRISLVDSIDHLSGSGVVGLTVNAAPPPVVTAPTSASLNENSSYTFAGSSINLSDPAASGASDSLTLSASFGKLTLGSTSGLTITSGSNNSSLMTIAGTLANLSAAMSGLVYVPTSGFSGHDTLNLALADPIDKLTGSAAVAITVNPIVAAPATAGVFENVPYKFSTAGNDPIIVTDGGASGTSDSLTLTVLHGKLTLASLTGLTVTAGSNGASSMTINGTLANLNAALNGLIYTPASNYTGSDTLTLNLTNSGDGLAASASVAITVAPKIIRPGVAMTAPAVASTVAPVATSSDSESDQWAGVTPAVETLYQ